MPIAAAGFILHEILTDDPHGWEDLKQHWGTVGQAAVFLLPSNKSQESYILRNGLTLDDLSRGAQQIDKNNLSLAGRALQKRGDRSGSIYPQIKGSAQEKNYYGQLIVDEVLTNPKSTFQTKTWNSNGIQIMVIEV